MLYFLSGKSSKNMCKRMRSVGFSSLTQITMCLMLLLASGCAVLPDASMSAENADRKNNVSQALPLAPDAALNYHILAGEMAAQRGVYDEAAAQFLQAAALSEEPELAEKAARFALYSGGVDAARLAVDYWIAWQPGALPARELALNLYLARDDRVAVMSHAKAIINLHPEGSAAGFRTVALILSSDPGKADLALGLLRDLVSEYASSEEARYALALAALRLERFDTAISESEAVITSRRDWVDAYLLKATAEVRAGRLDDADITMKRVRTLDPRNEKVILDYARLLLDSGYEKRAAREFTRVLTVSRNNTDALYALGLLSLDSNKFDTAYSYFKRMYESVDTQNSGEAAYFLGVTEESRQNYQEALDWYTQINTGNFVFEASQRRAYMYYKLGDLDKARQYLRQLRLLYPRQELKLILTEADLLYEERDYTAAVELYDEALAQFPEDTDLLYGRALILSELNHIDRAEADLRLILKEQPNDSRSLNALGYILTNHSTRFEEALGYITAALEQAPDDAAILDSMGWVQYRLGNLDTSLKYLENAYQRQRDAEIAAHLGEVLWKMGNTQKARKIWQDALEQNPDHPVLNETIQRFQQ